MSADFEKVLVKDPRLDVADSIKYAVIKGGQNVTASPFRFISETTSQVVFNIQVPSEQTIVDRRVLWQSQLQITTGNESTSQVYGITWSLASFPLHQLLSVMQATINNNTVSLNIGDVLTVIVRMLCCEDLTWWNSGAPTFADTQKLYDDAAGFNNLGVFNQNNPLSSLWGVEYGKNPHRGCFAPQSKTTVSSVTTWSFDIVEPLLISPFIFSNLKANAQGFYGIQNMNFILNKSSNFKKCARGNVSVGSATTNDSTLLFMFLTPHPSDLMPARNIVPFYELPRYITACPDIAASTLSNGPAAAATGEVVLNTLQLNQIPDKLLIYIRKPLENNSTDSDTVFPIGRISINFNNNSGILASAAPQQLWEMSRSNGLQNTWTEYCGFGVTQTDPSRASGGYQFVGTVGSYLVLEFGKDIQLTEDFYAAGSLGNFNLQVTLKFSNNSATAYNAAGSNNLQVILVTMNSGVFVNERGTSSTYTGILTKQDVLEASQQDHYTHHDVARMVGGGLFDMVKSGLSKGKKHLLKKGKELAQKHGEKLMEKGANALSKYLQ